MPWRRRRQEPTQGAWGQHWRDCAWIPILSEDVGPLHFMKSPSSLGGEISGRALAVAEDREALTTFVMAGLAAFAKLRRPSALLCRRSLGGDGTPGIHVFLYAVPRTFMAGSSPAMTEGSKPFDHAGIDQEAVEAP